MSREMKPLPSPVAAKVMRSEAHFICRRPAALARAPFGELLEHTSGELWRVRRGGHLHLYKLERR